MRRFTMRIGLLAIVAITGCGGNDGTGVTLEFFQAILTGDEEVPPVETEAEGLAEFIWDGTTMSYGIGVADIVEVTAAHIHDGEAGEPGPVLVTLVTLDPPESVGDPRVIVQSAFTEPDDGADVTMAQLLERMQSGEVYVNVHTVENGGGEIRGQIQLVEEQ